MGFTTRIHFFENTVENTVYMRVIDGTLFHSQISLNISDYMSFEFLTLVRHMTRSFMFVILFLWLIIHGHSCL